MTKNILAGFRTGIIAITALGLLGTFFGASASSGVAAAPRLLSSDPLFETCTGPGSDEFDGAVLDSGLWAEVNGPVADTLSGGTLTLPTAAANSTAAPMIAQAAPAGTQWQVTTQVTITPSGDFQQAGLVLWASSSSFIVLDTFWGSNKQRLQLNRNGTTSQIDLPSGKGPTLWLRLTRDGANITGAYSHDAGITWIQIGPAVSSSSITPTHIGITAFRGSSSTAPSIDAQFDWVRHTPTAQQLDDCAAALDDFDLARETWREMLVGDSGIDSGAEPYASRIAGIDAAASAAWTSLTAPTATEPWADLNTSKQAQAATAFVRIKSMALAWATPGGSLEGDAALLADTIEAMDRLTALRYYPGMAATGNWWYNEIGFPLDVNDITVILYDELDAAAIDRYMSAVNGFTPSPTGAGANRVWTAKVVAVRGLIVKDAIKVASARDSLNSVLTPTTSGQGFFADGSFVQHSYYPYTGGYGTSLLQHLADTLRILRDSPWAVVTPNVSRAYDWVATAFDPVMFEGVMMDAVRGREMSRETNNDADAGARAIRAILILAESAPTTTAAQIRAVAARHLLAGTQSEFFSTASLTELALGEAAQLAGAGPTPAGAYAFNSMDRAVRHWSDHAVLVAMSSSRIATYESINSENYRSWYTSDGMVYLYNDDAEHYDNHYWVTVNRYRMPGTTVDTQTRTHNAGAGYRSAGAYSGSVVGGSGETLLAAMRLNASGSTLVANKAWFAFEDEIVAVGSGITATGQSGTGWDGAARHVETVIEQRHVDVGNTWTVGGVVAGGSPGVVQSFPGTQWMHLADASGAPIGYVLPGGATVQTVRETRTGAWSHINSAFGASTIRSGEYVSAWLDHGVNPAGAAYSYILLPGASATETSAYAASPAVTTLANTATVSAVEHAGLGAVGASFWQEAGGALLRGGADWLTVDGRALVMVEMGADTLTLTLVEPTQARTAPLTLELGFDVAAVLSSSAGVTVSQLSPTTEIEFAVSGARGKTFTIELELP